VVVHAWDATAFEEIVEALLASGLEYRWVVTTTTDRAGRMQEILDRHDVAAELVVGPNKGRDILPFLRVANRLLDEGEDVVLKLHTKQSTHRRDGEEWRRDLLERLVSAEHAATIHAALVSDPKLGMVAPEGHVRPMACYWGATEERVKSLAARLGIPAPRVDADDFVAGSMFWIRLEALRPLLDAHLDQWEFEPEKGQVDGTCAHALERVLVACARASSHRVVDAATLCGMPGASPGTPYPFAARQ
jgi:lipopolysaccharide biosynthesis protein